MHPLSISKLKNDDIKDIVDAFRTLGWDKPLSQYENYLSEQTQAARTIFVARLNMEFAGYSTIVWRSNYNLFAQKNIPEIKDLNVLPQFRKQGIGRNLIVACEELSRSRKYSCLGLGVGLLPDYGSAQRLYFKMGYIPDGAGIHYGIQPLRYGQNVPVDDDLVLYLSKDL